MPYNSDRRRPVSRAAHDRLAAQAGRKPRIALAGEFSAGKSTLLNLLIGCDLLTMQVTATEAPAIRLCHGTGTGHWIDRRGTRQELPEGGLGALPDHCREVRLFAEANILREADIIDLPGVADPNRSDAAALSVLRGADMAIWCTPATQAWRQSERSLWASLPARLHGNAILVVTRADKLDSDHERDRVLRRLHREIEGMFSQIIMLSATQGIEALQERDTRLWAASGCGELIRQITTRTGAMGRARLALLDRYKIVEPAEETPAAASTVARPAETCSPANGAEGGILELVRKAREAHARRAVAAPAQVPDGGQAEPSEQTDPPSREVATWRQVVAQEPDFPGKLEFSRMIERYLDAISKRD